MARLMDDDDLVEIAEGENGPAVATALAVRCAFRVVPLLGGRNPAETVSDEAAAYMLVALRSLMAADACVRFPSRHEELRQAARNAALAAAKIRPFKTGDTATGRAAAQSCIEAVAAVAFSNEANARTARTTAAAFNKAASSVADGTTIERAAGTDLGAMMGGTTPAALLDQPLWAEGEPAMLAEVWGRLRAALLAGDEAWQFWIDWVEARRDGRPDSEPLAVARVLVPDETWLAGPTDANDALLALDVRPS